MTENSSFNSFDFKSDFTALTYEAWQLQQVKIKATRLINRLKGNKIKHGKKTRLRSDSFLQ